MGEHRHLLIITRLSLITAYTELLGEARNEAMLRMMQAASGLGANAIVNVRFATSAVAGGAAELFAYGTAVQVQ